MTGRRKAGASLVEDGPVDMAVCGASRSDAGSAVTFCTPRCSGKPLDRRVVPGTDGIGRVLLLEEVINFLGDNATNGVNCVVPRQALFHQAGKRANNRLVVQGQLILNDNVHRSAESPCAPGRRNSRVSMILFNEQESLPFINSQPILAGRCHFRIVAFHCPVTLVTTNVPHHARAMLFRASAWMRRLCAIQS